MPLRFDVPTDQKICALKCFKDAGSQRTLMDIANRCQTTLDMAQEIVNVLDEHDYIKAAFSQKGRLNGSWELTAKGVTFRDKQFTKKLV